MDTGRGAGTTPASHAHFGALTKPVDTHPSKNSSQRGFTIIEVMVAAMLLAVGVLGTVTLIDGANAVTNTNKAREGATALTREIVEVARSLPYEDLDGTALEASIQAQPGLADDDLGMAGWQILRRSATGAGDVRYVVDVFACTMDDEKDGARAASDTGTYCNGSVAAGSTVRVDNNPDDLRRVEIDVAYQPPGAAVPSCRGAGGADTGTGRNCVQQVTLVPNPTGGLGPSVRSSTVQVFPCSGVGASVCSATALGSGDAVEPQSTGVRITFSTNSAANNVGWRANNLESSEGLASATDSSLKNWELTWEFPSSLVDSRAYQVTIEASLLGAAGNPGVAAVPVNLRRPAAPDVSNVDPQAFGFNTRITPVAEFQWLPGNQENDLNNYVLMRADVEGNNQAPKLSGGNLDDFVSGCEPPGLIQSDLDCFDPSPPLTGTYNYYVIALDSRWDTVSNDPFDCNWETLERDPNDDTLPLAAGIVTVDPAAFHAVYPGARPGCPSRLLSVDIDALTLNVPRPSLGGSLSVATQDGAPQLTWSQDGVDGNPLNDPVAFYRIYRTSSNVGIPQYSDRYSTADPGGNPCPCSFADGAPQSGTNFYWVTAVDDQLQESDALGPVTWP